MPKPPRRAARAFTLLEVGVVIGVIAVIAALVIPAVVTFRARMGDVGCQNNLRQLFTALQMYNNDNKGSMPYGFYYVNSHPVSWQPVDSNADFVSWAFELNRYFGTTTAYAPAFRCPSAQQQAEPHPISYVMNFIVGVSPIHELVFGVPPNAQTKPPNLHLMMREGTALFWDTPIRADLANGEGYLVGADLDDQRFWRGASIPQLRYFLEHDPFDAVPPGPFGHGRPITMGANYRNIDPPANSNYPFQGNLRFRHGGQTKCNAAFSDGSVRQFTATIGANYELASHDALRRFFMIHWPPGVQASPTKPDSGGPPQKLPLPNRSKSDGPSKPIKEGY